MAERMMEKRAGALVKNRRRRLWARVVSALGCVVVFCTVYALILPAITASAETFCGKEEHAHTDACYERQLTCGLEESEGSAAYGHAHSSSCYQEEQVLVCALEESEEVLDEAGAVVAEGHAHGESCYSVESTLTCGQAESEDVVTEGHSHGDSCYERAATCGKKEHKHEDACFSDKTADVETAADWEATLPAAEKLEGVWAEDVLAVAESQLGYAESTKNYVVDEDAGYNRGYTRYGEWYGDPYGDWCAMFASFCLHYAGVEKEYMPRDAGCQNWIETLAKDEWGLWRPVKDGQAVTPASVVEKQHADSVEAVADEPYEPQPGDLVFFNWDAGTEDDDEVSDHVGIVAEVIPATLTEPEKLKTIEGNSTDRVEYVTYELADASIMGYADLPENPELVKTETEATEEVAVEQRSLSMVRTISDSVVVCQVNSYSQETPAATVVSGGSVGEILGSSLGFGWWIAVVVEKDSDGLYVSKIYDERSDSALKTGVEASTDEGFVLLVYGSSIGASVGQQVIVDFDYSGTLAYDSNGHGTVSFGSPKEDKDNGGKLDIVQSADTRGLIEVNLYDYNSAVNEAYLANSNMPGFQQDAGTLSSSTALGQYNFNFGNNITEDLDAGQSSVTVKDGGNINATVGSFDGVDYGYANLPASGSMSDELVGGYPALADGTSLSYLFSNSNCAAKQNVQSINGLFQHDEVSGAYTFNSRENHAQFNASDDTFTLYDQVISSNFMMYPFGNFLPFNDIVHESMQSSQIDDDYLKSIQSSALAKYNSGYGDEYSELSGALSKFVNAMDNLHPDGWKSHDAANSYFEKNGIPKTFAEDDEILQKVYTIDYDEPTDFYFGMEMSMTFMQPKDGLTGNDVNQDGDPDYPMVFYFTGDDDVWVYVDGKLFLDLSGIHRHVGGEIDFEKGVVRYYSLDVSTGDVSAEPYKTVTFAEILGSSDSLNENGAFKDYTTHTFNFYYMERGAGSGVCRMNFNFPLLKQNSISVGKEVSTDEADVDLLGNPDYRFQVLKADGSDSKTNDLFIAAGTAYTIYDESDNIVGGGTTDANGVFTLKAGQRAEFTGIKENAGKYYVRELLTGNEHGQYGNITVSGESTSVNYDVVVGEDSFTGVDSPVKDMSDGATSFRFNNQVTFTKLGALEISKTLTGYNQGQAASTEDFDFKVTLDGVALPVGTTYAIDGATEKTVQAAGIVAVPAGSTAKISNIVAGTEFVVEETSASSKGYSVTYAGSEGVSTSGDSASGTILAEESVSVAVANSENGDAVVIPIEKSLVNPDDKAHAYTFDLVQVTDKTGATAKEDGLTQAAELTVPAEGSVSDADAFVITYLERPEATLPVTYYYKVSERIDEAKQGSSVVFDEDFYVVEVTLKKDGSAFDASVTNVWKNGSGDPIADFSAASFENILLHDLTIEKQLLVPEGFDASGLMFEFTVSLAKGQVDLADSYAAIKTDADGVTSESTVEFKDGEAVIELEGGESLRIMGLPYGTTWSVSESQANGFHASYEVVSAVEDAEAVAGSSTGDKVLSDSASGVVFTNTGGYELPQTGGSGNAPYIFCGVLCLMGVAVLFVSTRIRGQEVRGAF